jgi:hypothetical protein
MKQNHKTDWERLHGILREISRQVDEEKDADLSYLLQATLKRIEVKMNATTTNRH